MSYCPGKLKQHTLLCGTIVVARIVLKAPVIVDFEAVKGSIVC